MPNSKYQPREAPSTKNSQEFRPTSRYRTAQLQSYKVTKSQLLTTFECAFKADGPEYLSSL